jgi:hypothetical protein
MSYDQLTILLDLYRRSNGQAPLKLILVQSIPIFMVRFGVLVEVNIKLRFSGN